MHLIWSLTLVFLAAAASLQAVDFGVTDAGNLVVNGSFEGPPISQGSESATFVPGWNVAGGTPVIQRSFNGVAAYDGRQNLAIVTANGSAYQDLATTPGQQYQIRYAYASSNQSQSSLTLIWGGTTSARSPRSARPFRSPQ